MISILMDSNKNLLLTKNVPLYQNERNVDVIYFYFPQYYDSLNLENFQALLKFNDGSEIYHQRLLEQIECEKENYLCYVTEIDYEFNEISGVVTMEVELSYNSSEYVLQTNTLELNIKAMYDFIKRYIYCGTGAEREIYDEEFIHSLDSQIKGTKSGAYTKNVAYGEYLFFSYPSYMGETPYFKINGFYVDTVRCNDVIVTDPEGATLTYLLYRTPQASTGVTTIMIE